LRHRKGTAHRQPQASVPAAYDVVVDAVIGIAGIAIIALALALLAHKAWRGGIAGAALAGAMAAYNEAWHTTAYGTHTEMQSQADRVAASDSPEDLWALASRQCRFAML
jgi:hypothetical protein